MKLLSVSLAAFLLFATIGLGWLFDSLYQRFSDNTPSQQQDSIAVVETLALQLASTAGRIEATNRSLIKWEQEQGYRVDILDQDDLLLPTSLIQQLRLGQPLTLESEQGIAIHVQIPETTDILLLEIPALEQDQGDDSTRYWLTSLFYVSLIGLLSLWLIPLVNRLIILRASAKRFGEGHLQQRIEVGGVSYIRDIESEFNHMAQRIEDLVGDVKLLSSAVSHDLRTPLAKIQMGLDTLSEESDPVRRKDYEARINQHVEEMVELVETLLQYARLDQAMLNIERQSVSLPEILESLIQRKQSDFIQFRIEGKTTDLSITGDQKYLKIMFNNLIQNAINYGKEQVLISLSRDEQDVVVCVEDNGSGVPEALAETLFKPFVRGKNTEHKGFGMGLAIVKRVAEWHSGSVSISRSNELGGACFELRFRAR